jgi:hypothetical protein
MTRPSHALPFAILVCCVTVLRLFQTSLSLEITSAASVRIPSNDIPQSVASNIRLHPPLPPLPIQTQSTNNRNDTITNRESIELRSPPLKTTKSSQSPLLEEGFLHSATRPMGKDDSRNSVGNATARKATLNVTSTGNSYMHRHAQDLQQQADRLELTRVHDLQILAKQFNQSTGTRIPYRLHFFTYATGVMNLTMERIILQAQRSQFFVTTTALRPQDLPLDFVHQYSDILNDPHGGGNFIWRYPIWELIMNRVPLYDYVLFLDAGCSILSTGHDMLLQWLDQLRESSERGVFHANHDDDDDNNNNRDRKEMIRFPQDPLKFREMRWTTDATFEAFGLDAVGNNKWSGAMTAQLFGGLLLVRNGPQWRSLTSFIYTILAPNPYILTDRYSLQTKQRRPGRFEAHRHDQSVSSIASKILNTYLQGPFMDTWHNPPFGVTRFRNITRDQLVRWSTECQHAPRDKDVYCDQLIDTIFQSNTVVE